ncbi:MAG: lycopene cyclase domain-containing protein [Rhodothermales bacterium]
MTYLTFHLVFLLPPIAVLALALRRVDAARGSIKFVALLCGLALVYTTPWDNYLVYREVWSYGSDRVAGTIGYVPVEEYLFFLLQPLLTGLWLLVVLDRLPHSIPGCRHPGRRRSDVQSDVRPGMPSGAARNVRSEAPSGAPAASPSDVQTLRRAGAVAGSVVALTGALCIAFEQTLYLGLILAWAGPVVAGQWFLAGERFINRACLPGIAVPTLYLWIADRIAIGDGIWSISTRYTIGWEPLGLPVEEAVFFLVTNILVVQGLLMFIDGKPSSGGQ